MHHLAIPVTDQERSRRFYAAHYGFDAREPRRYSDGVLMLENAEGFKLALGQATTPPRPPAWLHFGVALEASDDVRALRRRLETDGAEVVEAYDEPDYVSVKVRDPDGYIVEAFWEP